MLFIYCRLFIYFEAYNLYFMKTKHYNTMLTNATTEPTELEATFV